MIPYHRADLRPLAERAREQTREVERLLTEGTSDHASWRPDQGTWSIAGHAAHLALVNGPYLDSIHASAARARADGRAVSDGPYRHSMVSRWFVGQLEPPPKRRLKTFKAMVPDPATSPEQALADFRAAQERLLDEIEHVDGLDLGRIRFGSPFFAPLRLSAGTALALLVVHNDRHIWLMHEVNSQRLEG